MNKERIFKYLGYAVGEIILVVIGIVIALQLDNWNDNRQQRQVEIKYLKEIRKNLISDRSDINWNINFNEEKNISTRHVLRFLDGEIPYSDTLRQHFGNVMLNVTRTIVNISAYENVKSRGLEIITNDSLREQITTLYSTKFYNMINFEEHDDHPLQYSLVLPEVTKAIRVRAVWKDAEPIDRVAILRNEPLRNALRLNLFVKTTTLGWYRALDKRVEDTIAAIDAELVRLE